MTNKIAYAVGDVHGRLDLLEAIIEFVERDASAKGAAPRFVFLGDIVDRGKDSRFALELVASTLSNHPGSVLIKGNHDDWFSRFLGGDSPNPFHAMGWLQKGGMATILSYGCSEFDMARDLVALLHSDHIAMLRDAPLSLSLGGYHFVHAGVNPRRPLNDQTDRDAMWIREGFLDHVGTLDKVIVHGHTVVGDRPVVTENRVSIDTGAYQSGRLTVMSIGNAGEVAFHQTDGSARNVVQVEPILLDRGLGIPAALTGANSSAAIAA